jgi:hypothetical protein
MKKHSMAFIKASLMFLLLLVPTITFALRCGSDLVLKGDRKIEVLKSCGEPAFIEKWQEETITHVTGEKDRIYGDFIFGGETKTGISNFESVEEWTYNFGPYKFIRYLTFINGKLKKIEDGPRGAVSDTLAGSYHPRCGHLAEKGDRKIEVIINCGDPYLIEYSWEERFSAVSNAVRIRKIPRFYRSGNTFKKDYRFIRERIYEQKRKVINIEEWSYNFGPTKFLHFIKFENGKVIKVEKGDYGF